MKDESRLKKQISFTEIDLKEDKSIKKAQIPFQKKGETRLESPAPNATIDSETVKNSS